MVRFTGVGQEIDKLMRGVAELHTAAVQEVKVAVRVVSEAFASNTPVWSGETVRNYMWGAGSMPTGFRIPPSGSLPEVGDNSEKNRTSNENAMLQAANSAVPAQLTNMFLTNTIEVSKWNLIDAGLAPSPGRSRYPAGVSGPAIQAARAALTNWR